MFRCSLVKLAYCNEIRHPCVYFNVRGCYSHFDRAEAEPKNFIGYRCSRNYGQWSQVAVGKEIQMRFGCAKLLRNIASIGRKSLVNNRLVSSSRDWTVRMQREIE